MAHNNKRFLHINGDEGFQSRSKSVFEGLDGLEPSKESEKSPSRDVRRGKRRRPNPVPDHVLHPEKWTKYTLQEDGSESLGHLSANEVNRHAALSFLNNRRKLAEEGETRTQEEHFIFKHYVFTKRRAKDHTNTTSAEIGHATNKQGVNIMPEYVVGRTKPQYKTTKLNCPPTLSKQADVHISHLLDADQDSHESQVTHNKEKVVFSKYKHRCDRHIRKHRSSDDDG